MDIIDYHSSVLFATFAVFTHGKRMPSNGMIEPMLSYFLPKVRSFDLLIQPHPGSDRIDPIIETYKNTQKAGEAIMSPLWYSPLYLLCFLQNVDDTHISFKLRDFFSVLYAGFVHKGRYDLYIGLECINALAGIVLRKLGRVKNVIYYVSDYAPKRFSNKIFNQAYLWLDRFCIEHADFTWDVSPAINLARKKAGVLRRNIKTILHVPNGLFPSQIDHVAISRRIPHSIVYMGLLNPDQHGVDLALKAFSIVLKTYPDATFHVIGGTNRKTNPFMDMVRDLGLKRSVISHGFVPPNKQMSALIKRCSVGVATYRSDRNPRNRYGDSGKIRQYLACGLPFVATTLQWFTRYAIKNGAGIGVRETPEDFARAILKLFKDRRLYATCSQKAVTLSKQNTWEHSYRQAFQEMEAIAHMPRGQSG